MSRNGEDRFYSVTRARRSRNHLRRTQSDVTTSRSQSRADEPLEKGKLVDAVLKVVATEPSPSCNLKRFLESVIPSVPAQHLSKTTIRGWKTCNVEFQPYFVLGDLWESFQEWSAYGAGVPLLLNDSDSVVQYYVPYLSGIQLYADHSKSSAKSRKNKGETDAGRLKDMLFSCSLSTVILCICTFHYIGRLLMFSSFTVEHLGLNWLRVYARVEKVSDGTLLFFTKVLLYAGRNISCDFLEHHSPTLCSLKYRQISVTWRPSSSVLLFTSVDGYTL
ncbi:Hypothetical predicted protein, partial [Olea europaea subsp. europaea]